MTYYKDMLIRLNALLQSENLIDNNVIKLSCPYSKEEFDEMKFFVKELLSGNVIMLDRGKLARNIKETQYASYEPAPNLYVYKHRLLFERVTKIEPKVLGQRTFEEFETIEWEVVNQVINDLEKEYDL